MTHQYLDGLDTAARALAAVFVLVVALAIAACVASERRASRRPLRRCRRCGERVRPVGGSAGLLLPALLCVPVAAVAIVLARHFESAWLGAVVALCGVGSTFGRACAIAPSCPVCGANIRLEQETFPAANPSRGNRKENAT